MLKVKPKDTILLLSALLVVLLGLFAYFNSRSTAKREVSVLSDEVSAIEKDLNSTNVNSLDSDLPMIEGQLK